MNGFYQASRVAIYSAGVALLLGYGNEWFGEVDKFVGPMMFLILFVVSVLTCALFVFARPYQLFIDKKCKEALELVISTTKWLAFYLAIVFGWLILK